MYKEVKGIFRRAIFLGIVALLGIFILILNNYNSLLGNTVSSDTKNTIKVIVSVLFIMLLFMVICYAYISYLMIGYRRERKIATNGINSAGLYHLRLSETGYVEWCNENFYKTFEYSKSQLKNTLLSSFSNLSNDQLLQKLIEGKSFNMNLYKDGKESYISWNVVKGSSLNSCGFDILGLDTTELVLKERKIMEMDFHDELTGMYNKKKLFIEGEKLIYSHKDSEFVIICLDIQRFQELCNLRGRAIGDKAIKIIAESFMYSQEKYEDIVCGKIGIDVFALLIKGDEAQAMDLYNRIIHNLNTRLKANGFGNDIRFTQGAAKYPLNGFTIEEIYEKADITLKIAKRQNTDGVMFYDKEVIKLLLDKRALESSMRKALEYRQFELYYQPKVDLATGKLVGREALIRWIHPEKGVISPSEFIPLAEETGLVLEIDDWGLRAACIQNALWHKNNVGPKVSVSVNVCAKEFYNGDIVERVKRALTISGLEPKYLDIEVTESMTMVNIEEVRRKLKELKDLGVTLSLDDFGTGYSSLSYLQTIPIDVLKLDISFIRDIKQNATSGRIVGAIVELAKSIGIQVLAEGIEEEEQNAILLDLGCTYGQGFLFGKAARAEQIEEKYKTAAI